MRRTQSMVGGCDDFDDKRRAADHTRTMSTARPTALITGAAKRIGAAIATHLAASGYDIVLHYHRSHAEAKKLAAELSKKHGARVTLHAADLEQTGSLTHFWDGLPKCEVLILNAAMYEHDTLADFSPAQLQRQLTVNLQAPLVLAQGFMAQLPKKAHGNIVVLGDGVIGGSVSPNHFTYAVSKISWYSVIDVLAASVAPRVRANLLGLPPVIPNITEDQALYDRIAARAPLKRNGTPAEVCTAIDFLLASPGVTGQALLLSNGITLASATTA